MEFIDLGLGCYGRFVTRIELDDGGVIFSEFKGTSPEVRALHDVRVMRGAGVSDEQIKALGIDDVWLT